MALVLRKHGKPAEAEAVLPEEEKVGAAKSWRFLQERSEIYLESGRLEEAIAGFERLTRWGVGDPPVSPFHRLDVEVSLAEAYLAADRLEESETCARRAADALRTAGHLDLSEVMVTLALIAWRRGEDASAWWPDALRVFEDVALVQPSIKGRSIEKMARRLDRAGRVDEAAEARAAAAEQWRTLGL